MNHVNSSVHVLERPPYASWRAFCCLLVVVALMLPISVQAAVSASTVTALVNAERVEGGLTPLTTSAALTRAAQAKANDMAANGYFAHTSPEGRTFSYWIKDAGYAYKSVGENLAQGFTESDRTVEGWMNSSGHRTNIMATKYTQTGVATAVGTYEGKKTTFVVQLFGTPADEVAVAKPEPKKEAAKPVASTMPRIKLQSASAATVEKPVATVEPQEEVSVPEPVQKEEVIVPPAPQEKPWWQQLVTLLIERVHMLSSLVSTSRV